MEHWIEINIDAEVSDQDRILLDFLLPHVKELERKRELITWHYFREPEIRFRVRVSDRSTKSREMPNLARIADSLVRRNLASGWHLGRHGEEGVAYEGEADRYGQSGWRVAQDYFMDGSETALALLKLKRRSKLESPLWAKGLGNPWEGGEKNPWREKEGDPLAFHWSRFVHLFSNQLGFDMEKEAELCAKQSEKYTQVAREFGMRW